jgi:hypothetical protein
VRGRRLFWILTAAAALAATPLALDFAGEMLHDRMTIRSRRRFSEFLDRLPYRVHGRSIYESGEVSAISTLRRISSAEAEFQATALADEDRDGTGEYGGFLELSSAAPVRGRDAPIKTPVVSGIFRTLDADGEVKRSGYVFRVWLPTKSGAFVGETGDGFPAGRLDPDAAERRWRCFAWPANYDHTGLRTFAVDELGDIFGTEDERWSGAGAGPDAASFDGRPNADATTWTSPDGHVWKQVN